VGSFYFNLYQDPDNNNRKTCSCVTNYIGTRFVPVGIVFAACIGRGSGLSIQTRVTKRHDYVLRPGEKFVFKVRIQNRERTVDMIDLGVRVSLPTGISYLGKSHMIPRVKSPPKPQPIVNGSIVDFPYTPLRRQRKQTIRLALKVNANVSVGSVLPIEAFVYQSSSFGLTYCDLYPDTPTKVLSIAD